MNDQERTEIMDGILEAAKADSDRYMLTGTIERQLRDITAVSEIVTLTGCGAVQEFETGPQDATVGMHAWNETVLDHALAAIGEAGQASVLTRYPGDTRTLHTRLGGITTIRTQPRSHGNGGATRAAQLACVLIRVIYASHIHVNAVRWADHTDASIDTLEITVGYGDVHIARRAIDAILITTEIDTWNAAYSPGPQQTSPIMAVPSTRVILACGGTE